MLGELWQVSPQLCAEGRVSHLKGMNAFRKLGHMFPKEEREEGRGGEGKGGEERRLINYSINSWLFSPLAVIRPHFYFSALSGFFPICKIELFGHRDIHSLIPYTNIKSKWSMDLNMK